MMVGLALVVVFVAGAAPAFGAAYAAHHLWGGVFDFFKTNMRGSFFAGFLTIGGFMLSLKTFVLVKMKEGLYASDEYKKRQSSMCDLGSRDSLYAPLKRLSHLLFFSILAALVTSALQLTLGLWSEWWAAGVCVAAAGGTLAMLVFSLISIKTNLDAWFDCLDEDARKAAAAASTGSDGTT
jgi:hypothetical protein